MLGVDHVYTGHWRVEQHMWTVSSSWIQSKTLDNVDRRIGNVKTNFLIWLWNVLMIVLLSFNLPSMVHSWLQSVAGPFIVLQCLELSAKQNNASGGALTLRVVNVWSNVDLQRKNNNLRSLIYLHFKIQLPIFCLRWNFSFYTNQKDSVLFFFPVSVFTSDLRFDCSIALVKSENCAIKHCGHEDTWEDLYQHAQLCMQAPLKPFGILFLL